MAGTQTVDRDNGNLRNQVAENFELDDGDLEGEPGTGDDDSDPDAAGDDATGDDTGDVDEPLNDFEKFMRDTERVDPQAKKGKGKDADTTQQQQKPLAADKPNRYEKDQKGNIIDPKTGNVLARAGAEARLYMESRTAKMDLYQAGIQNQQLRGHIQEAVKFIDQYRAELRGLREANAHATNLGVSQSEAAQAVEFVARLKKGGADAITAIKEILTRAAANGIDVASLGAGGSAIDVKAIVDQMRQEFAPIKKDIDDRTTSARQQQENEQANRANWNKAAETTLNFFQTNQDAIPYAKVIEAGLRDPRFAGWTIREVWQHIQLHLAKNPSGSSESSHRNGQREVLPRGRRPANGTDQTFDAMRPAPVSMRYEDLVNEVLDQGGY